MSIEDDRTESANLIPPQSTPATRDLSLTAAASRRFSGPGARDGSITRPPLGDEMTDASDPRAPGATLLRGEIVDRYVIISPLGQGGMGVVYAAYDPDLDRRVALKLLLPQADGGTHSAGRLLREAQALARLAHPNVVAVHDVGMHGEQVWIAMEFVAGVTLGAWAQSRSLPWPEVVRVLADAARGVAAAHAAGLVHRDLKPDNVMIGADGRVRVMDFGLAHGRALADGELGTTLGSGGEPHSGPAALSVRMTQVGAIQGTPAYMAPEQWQGQEAQVATDQFGWSVMAWELLYGARPFAGENRAVLAAAVITGKRQPPPRGRSIPKWLRKLVERGLASDPARRWPGMAALLAQLERGQAQSRVRTTALVLGGFALLGLGALGWQRWRHTQQVAACDAAGLEIGLQWNDEARAGLRSAFAATGMSYAAISADKIMPWLDVQATALAQGYTQVCMHTEVERDWDTDTMERARWCLDERREAMASLVGELTQADTETLDKAVAAAAGLRSVDPCLDADQLRRHPAPPAEAQEAVATLRARLALADTLQYTGKYARGLEVAKAARVEAEALGWAPLTAALYMREGSLLEKTGAFAPAEAALMESLDRAITSSAWEVASAAATQLIMLGTDRGQLAEALRWVGHAEAIAAHTDDAAGLHAALRLGYRATLHHQLGEIAKARPLYEQAIALREQMLGPDHPEVATGLHNFANFLGSTGSYAEARALFERALEIRERAFGPDHPSVLVVISGLASTHRALGDPAKARALQELALASTERALGPDHPRVAGCLNDLAGTLSTLGEYPQALAMQERSLDITEKVHGPDHPDIATRVSNIAGILLDAGEATKARPLFERGLAIWEKKLGPDHLNVAISLNNLGDVHRIEGDNAGARALYRRSLAIREDKLGPDNPKVAAVLVKLANLELEDEHPAEALALVVRAFKIYDAHADLLPGEIDAHFNRAQALVATGGDRTQALADAEFARSETHKLGPGKVEVLAEIEAWLAKHNN